MTIIIFSTLAIFSLLFLLWFTIISYIENESRATKIGIILSLFLPALLLSSTLLPDIAQQIIVYLLISSFSLLALSFLFPGEKKSPIEQANYRIDERDTMFSRNEITHSTEKSQQYYHNNPDKLELDKEWHQKPGLMDEKAAMYSPLAFAAADASFFTIEELRQSVNPKVSYNKQNIDIKEITTFIQNWSKKLGAINVGICELQPYHFYSHRGRGAAYGETVKINHKFGIAFTVEMDKDFVNTGPSAPTVMESAQQYLNSGTIAVQMAKFISNLGYEARAHIDGNYEIVCPLVAVDAGLGDIGRMGLLMTPKLGPRVRIAVVTTSLPLETSAKKPDYTVQDFCNICKKCAIVCPSQAIPKTEKQNINGVNRWQINQEKCFSYWCTSGTDCGRCISVCPYSHPNNLLHNIVRWGIKHSWFFRRFALYMDNFIYGQKPKPASIPWWIPTKKQHS